MDGTSTTVRVPTRGSGLKQHTVLRQCVVLHTLDMFIPAYTTDMSPGQTPPSNICLVLWTLLQLNTAFCERFSVSYSWVVEDTQNKPTHCVCVWVCVCQRAGITLFQNRTKYLQWETVLIWLFWFLLQEELKHNMTQRFFIVYIRFLRFFSFLTKTFCNLN